MSLPPESQQNQQLRIQNKPQQQQSQKNPINEIKKLGKKYANLSGPKLEAAKTKILKFAEEVAYEDLEPLFETPAKKVGTRIATLITLGVLLKKGQERTENVNSFIESVSKETNELIIEELKNI